MKGILDAIDRCLEAKHDEVDFLEKIRKMILDRMEDEELEEEYTLKRG